MAQQGLNLGGLFASKKPQPQEAQVDLNEVVRDVTRRLRVLEERMTTDRKNIQLNQQNVLTASKKVNNEVKAMYSEVNDLKKELSSINEQLNLVMSALKDTTKKEDVKVLEKYIELWEPVNFATRNDVEKIIDEKLGEKKVKSK